MNALNFCEHKINFLATDFRGSTRIEKEIKKRNPENPC
jgi:hypothetical protein